MAIPVVYVSNADARPRIIDADGNEFILPKTFNVRSEPAAKKQALMDVAFAHGARDVSDGKMSPRVIEISGKIWAGTDDAYNTAWDALAAQLVKENFKLQDRGRQINVWKVQDIQHAFPSQVQYRYGEVVLQLLCLDPFWYAIAAKTKTFPVESSPRIFQFDALGNADIYPVITIANGATNTDFTLEATTDAETSFRIQDSGALSGTNIVVDCAAGTVKRNGTDIISKFSGKFLRILGGRENRFTYTGAIGMVISLSFKEAWL
jgi:phage-related protein